MRVDTAELSAGHKSKSSFTFSVTSPYGPILRILSEPVANVRNEGLTLLVKEHYDSRTQCPI